ncbi:MAG: lysophospholipid acyltransferase family protein, partial [Elusimicrobiota bacterium]
MEIKSYIEDFRNLLLKGIAPLVIKFICGSSKIEKVNFEAIEGLRKKFGSIIYAFWHGRQLALLYNHRQEGVVIMSSYSKDGELQTKILTSFGYDVVRGSHQKRGAVEGTIEMLKKVEHQNKDAAFAVDGPHGPGFEVKEGVLYIARKTKRPILPISYSAKYRKVLSNWDRYLAPAPFNRIVIVYGRPVEVNENDDLSKKALELAAELNRITDYADKVVD